MGTAVLRLVGEADGLDLADRAAEADVVIDYSHPDWTGPLLEQLAEHPRPLVIGTTGLTGELQEHLRQLSKRVPVVQAANTGTGIAVLRRLVEQAAASLGEGWDIEVLEMHHRKKVDAPSGTAWLLVDAAGGRDRAVPSRVGETGARTDAEIGVQTLRGGDVVGEHTVYLVGHGERLELTHRAWDRDTFARGGVRAARWLLAADRKPGLYSMNDVLGL
ncbi:MAG: 4-hydroxy-tetrahydrodipicolinate reductase [Proteobacteria bacterium]|nr:4-hydroxy-tetrahydrodipicolinate reductase [Pseudomonadota bacterium]